MKYKKCPKCPRILEGQLPNGETLSPHFSANCVTTGVVYLMLCTYQAFYVGKTIRELRQRIGEHLYCSTSGKLTTIGRHIGLHHRYNPLAVKFLILEVVATDPRGGDRDRVLLQQEALWIERLNALIPPGLNEVNSFKSFV